MLYVDIMHARLSAFREDYDLMPIAVSKDFTEASWVPSLAA
jgi:hypothetical protein